MQNLMDKIDPKTAKNGQKTASAGMSINALAKQLAVDRRTIDRVISIEHIKPVGKGPSGPTYSKRDTLVALHCRANEGKGPHQQLAELCERNTMIIASLLNQFPDAVNAAIEEVDELLWLQGRK